MKNTIQRIMVGGFFSVLLALIIYFWVDALDTSVNKNNNRTMSIEIDIVDSVDVIRPGEINTLQFDYMYKIHTKNSHEFTTRNKYSKGDTLQYIFYNTEK
jgi:hypothetical protein